MSKPGPQPYEQRSSSHAGERKSQLIVYAYTTAILGAELIGTYLHPLFGTVLHGLLLLLMLTHFAGGEQLNSRLLLPGLALIPLLRILSLTVVTAQVPSVYLYVFWSIPLTIAIALVSRLTKLSWADIGFQRVAWRPQAVIAMSGWPLSLLGFLLLRPTPLIEHFTWPEFIVASLILMICAGAVEEILFRGLLYRLAEPLFGARAVLYGSVMYAITYLGWMSVNYLLFAGLLGLCFGWCVRRTGSLWGVLLAHGFLNIGMLLVWPLLL